MLKPQAFVINAATRSRIRAMRVANPPLDGAYTRQRDLSRLLAIWPEEVTVDLPARERVLAKLERALRAERRRGVAGHWTYDLSRHVQLVAALRREQMELAELRRTCGLRLRQAGADARE